MFSSRKRRSVAAGLLLTLALAVGAYAYWSNTGDGSGSATTANPADDQLTVNQVGSVTDLRPGAAAQDVDVTVTNGSTSDVLVQSIGVSLADTIWVGDCEADDYTISGSPATVSQSVAAGTTSGTIDTGITIAFNNEVGEDQNDCKGQALVLTFTAG